ncbi:MAG TPA: hypothetical protein PKM63_20535 [Panacibacter sp.]|nr:hypothetical protein [Panacibacter sp.]HNP46696.1 hypothetical protein [Panacibacter sp.]
MAKQAGQILITGTIDQLCFYQMDGIFYVRKKSSLSGKRVKGDPAFAGTMRYANLLAEAAKIASGLYRVLPVEQKAKGLYKVLTGKVMQLLKAGKSAEQVVGLLQELPAPEAPVMTTEEAQQQAQPVRVPAVNKFAGAVKVIVPANVPAVENAPVSEVNCFNPP